MEKIKQESIGDVFFEKEIDNKQQLSIEQCHIDLNIALKVPENIARRYTLVAIGLENHQLKVAMKEPFNMYALDDLRLITKLPIKPVTSVSLMQRATYSSRDVARICFSEPMVRTSILRRLKIS